MSSRPVFSEEDIAILPNERSETIPSAWYTHPDFHGLDQDAIFSRTWQYVGHTSQASKVGGFFLASVADHPVMVGQSSRQEAFLDYWHCRVLQCEQGVYHFQSLLKQTYAEKISK